LGNLPHSLKAHDPTGLRLTRQRPRPRTMPWQTTRRRFQQGRRVFERQDLEKRYKVELATMEYTKVWTKDIQEGYGGEQHRSIEPLSLHVLEEIKRTQAFSGCEGMMSTPGSVRSRGHGLDQQFKKCMNTRARCSGRKSSR